MLLHLFQRKLGDLWIKPIVCVCVSFPNTTAKCFFRSKWKILLLKAEKSSKLHKVSPPPYRQRGHGTKHRAKSSPGQGKCRGAPVHEPPWWPQPELALATTVRNAS